MDRCTGNATSTLGGGGGTKLFCSQALKTPNAATAKAARHATAPLRPAAPRALLLAGEHVGFMSLPQSFVLESSLRKKQLTAPPHKNSNNPLAGEPETENDAARGNFFANLVHDFTSVDATAPATTTRIYSNVQHVDTCDNAWGVADRGDFYNQLTRVFAGALPGAT
jgi:hypothetical protein